jgi:hypothetical protein
VTVALARWLLRLRKRRLEQLVGRPDYERRHSLELDRIVKALEALS